MTEGMESATGYAIPGDEKNGWGPESIPGLSKRESFAMYAMQGLLSNPVMVEQYKSEYLCELSVKSADDLIKALNEE